MDSDRLRQMADAATPGPWEAEQDEFGWLLEQWDGQVVSCLGRALTPQDVALVAALGPDAARLLADAMDALKDALVTFTGTDWQQRNLPLLARYEALGGES